MGWSGRRPRRGSIGAIRGAGGAVLAIFVLTGTLWPVAFDPIHAQDFDVEITPRQGPALQSRTRAPQNNAEPDRGVRYYDGEWTGPFSCDAHNRSWGKIGAVNRTTLAIFRDGTWQREVGIKGQRGFENYRITVGPDGKARMKGHWIRGSDRLFQEAISLRGNAFADPENPGVEVLELSGKRAGAGCTMRLTRVAGTAADAEQARQVEVFIEGQAFVAPPRTVSDITAVLDKAPARDFPRRAQDRALLDEEPSQALNRSELVQFYVRRGEAAGRLGDSRRELADLRLAEGLSRDAPAAVRDNLLFLLGRAERASGRMQDAIRYYVERIGYARNGKTRAARMLDTAFLEVVYGDITGAAARRDEARFLLTASLGDPSSWSQKDPTTAAKFNKVSADLLLARGRYREAADQYVTALEEIESGRAGLPDPFVRSARSRYAVALLQLGRTAEAESEVRKNLLNSLFELGRNDPWTAFHLGQLGRIVAAQGRFGDAETLFQIALEIFEAVGVVASSRPRNETRVLLAGTLFRQGRWDEVSDIFAAVEQDVGNDDPAYFKRRFANNLDWALALLRTGRAADSEAMARAAAARKERALGSKSYDTAQAFGTLAVIRAEAGDHDGALELFQAALPILLSRSRQSDGDDATSRTHRLRIILQSYISLMADIRGTALEDAAGIDAAAEAFRIADIARSRIVEGAVAASGARAAAGNAELAELIRSEQDERKQISALFGLLANVRSLPANEQNPAAVLELRTQIDQLRDSRAALAQEIEQKFPDYASLANPKPATIETARAALRDGEALIATYVTQDRTFVWAVPKTGPVAFAAVLQGKDDIELEVALMRSGLDTTGIEYIGDILDFDLVAARNLYTAILEPVEAGWRETQSLLIVPHGALGQIPFSLLVSEPVELEPEAGLLFSRYQAVPWLARTHAVTVLPSVASLESLRKLPPGNPERRALLAFADPFFSEAQAADADAEKQVQVAALAGRGAPSARTRPARLRAAPSTRLVDSATLALLPRLPDTADEVLSVAAALNADLARDIFIGRRATEQAVKSLDLSGYRVLVFATHGLVPGDLDGLTQPALALSSPVFDGSGEDGILTMGEVLSLRLDADWVVLSACNTAAGDGAGAEAFTGLGQAFFYAGTRAVLLSNWSVESVSAKLLTTDLFRRQAEDQSLTRAGALRQSMLALIDGPGSIDPQTGRALFSYAHPLFWAPFSLVGDGGGPT